MFDTDWDPVVNKIILGDDGKMSLKDFLAAAVNHKKLVTRENIT